MKLMIQQRSLQRSLLSCLAAIGVGVLLAACGGGSQAVTDSAQQTYDKFAQMTGQARHDALVDAAKKEGSLSIYATSPILEKQIVPAFKNEYGIDVTVYRGTTEDVRQRVLQEASADRVQNDLVETKDSEMAILGQQNLLSIYTSDIADALPAQAKNPYMSAAYYIATLPLYNNTLLQSTEVPGSFEDYTDPKWAGKIALDQGDFNWYNDMYRYYTQQKSMSDDAFITMMKGIAANTRVVNGHVANTELLKAGDFPVFLADFLHYVPTDGSGTLGYTPTPDPVTLQLLGVQPMKAAPHPAAALLFADFYLTDAQKMLNDAGYIPANPDQIDGYQSRLPASTVFVTDDWETLANKGNDWSTAYDNLLKGTDPVLPVSGP